MQLGGGPLPSQLPASLQTSMGVQALLSLHGVPGVVGVWTHPLVGLHVSTVHGLLSSQFGGEPPTHVLTGWQPFPRQPSGTPASQ